MLIEHISIKLMIVDLKTKALSAKQYRDHVNNIGLANPFDIWLQFLLVDCLDYIFLCYS